METGRTSHWISNKSLREGQQKSRPSNKGSAWLQVRPPPRHRPLRMRPQESAEGNSGSEMVMQRARPGGVEGRCEMRAMLSRAAQVARMKSSSVGTANILWSGKKRWRQGSPYKRYKIQASI